MKSRTEYLTFDLPARMGFENITPRVEQGAVECQNAPAQFQSAEVKIRAEGSVFDTTLADLTYVSVAHPQSFSGSAWNGLLLPYTGQIVLSRDSQSDVYGPDGNSGYAHPSIYQRLYQPDGTTDDSEPIAL